MKIMSINAGSSSLKFSLFEMPEEILLVTGNFERIGDDSFLVLEYNGEKTKKEVKVANHEEAVEILVNELVELEIINSLDELEAVGHRVVHGGAFYKKSTQIDEELINKVDELSALAPLHNPVNLIGINSFKKMLPNTPMVAVFDTAFHQTINEEEYLYTVPYEWYEKYGVRKYGFHGTSHNYVSNEISKQLQNKNLKTIICHIGNGASISAVKDMKCVNTSMGFTPNSGLMMGTRSGDIGFSIIPYVMEKTGKSLDEVLDDLNKKSGLLGVSGISSDCRDIEDAIARGKDRAILANNLMIKKVVNYISMYNTLLGGADVICFTAGLGEKAIDFRAGIVNSLSALGIKLDEKANNVRSEFTKITTEDSKIACYIVPTNEELMIAKDTYTIVSEK